MPMSDKAKLPAGKTCNNCVNFSRCYFLCGVFATDTRCDFDPSRFIVGDVWNLAGDVPHIRFRIGIMAHQAVISHRLVFEQGVEVIDA